MNAWAKHPKWVGRNFGNSKVLYSPNMDFKKTLYLTD